MAKKKTKCKLQSYEAPEWKIYKNFLIYDGQKSIVKYVLNKNLAYAKNISTITLNNRKKKLADEYLNFGYTYGILQLPTYIVQTCIYEILLMQNLIEIIKK